MSNNFVRYHLPFYLFAALILSISSLPQFKPPDMEIVFADKIAHFFEYGIFAFLALRSLGQLSAFKNRKKLYPWVLVISVVFAALDEWHQAYIPGRFSDIYDFIADTIGIVVVLLSIYIQSKRKATMKSGY
ncbi:MAG: VanZ family protein [candidate division Zixibacteria bacterium]